MILSNRTRVKTLSHQFKYIALLTLFALGSCSNSECQKTNWYQDSDGDGLGNPQVSVSECEKPLGYVSNNDDMDDTPKADVPVENTLSIPTTGYTTPVTYENLNAVWADEFNGTSLDETYWNFQIGDGCPDICGWGNNELEYYTKENTTVKDGYLIIEAKKQTFNSKNYTSSRINTQGKFTLQFGRVDVRASLPEGQGIWPAIWMLGENISSVGWPACGEIDIMEMIGGEGREKTVHGTVHWDNVGNYASYGQSYSLTDQTFKEEFHVFSIVWTPETITWYIDDIEFNVIDITPVELNEFQNEFHFLINLAVGGNWPGDPNSATVFPQFLIVDYIRVFQEKE
ncbi:beta-glucanase (GH16 family) [Saonia flava]|uniref:Beta-glucanase (GH16 family) n=1 Tax=Saonia flava TaxID=523696 RepID=A0A846R3H6_9FLAO|nr:glycoside hydrolase family 16 protein [Saonia flava]NJB72525.1 beta-glucanase (GH16 family) [Saonia flava]